MKGMQKIKRGTGFRGVLEYALDEGRGLVIGGNMSGVTPRELAKEFGQSRKLREDIEKPVWHNSLRLPEGEHLSPEKLEKIADAYMKKMGFGRIHQRVYIMHDEPNGQHIHIIASRIDLEGKLYLGKNENLKSTQYISQLEREHGLVITRLEADPTKIGRRVPPPGIIGKAEREGELPVEMRMQALIDDAAADRPNFETLIKRLEASGMTIIPSGATGQPQGISISFGFDGATRAGSKLGGASYKWASIKKRIDYDPVRDQAIIDELRSKVVEEKGDIAPMTLVTASAPTGNGRRTIDIAFNKETVQEATLYRWNTTGAVALIDHGDSISICNAKNLNLIKASLQLSRDKGWTSVKATGSLEFKRQTWLIGNQLGIEIEGYEPTPEDIEALKQIIQAAAEAKAKQNEWKNSRHAGAGPEERARDQNSGRADGANADNGDKSIAVSGRPEDHDGRSEERAVGVREPINPIIELQPPSSANADDPQSAGNADNSGSGFNWGAGRTIRDGAQSVSALADAIEHGNENKAENRDERPDLVGHHKVTNKNDPREKIKAWEKQSNALGAEKYRVTLTAGSEKDAPNDKLFDQNYSNLAKTADREIAGIQEKCWNNAELKDLIYKLREKNRQGYAIDVTPLDHKFHFIVIDDITPEKLASLLGKGIEPAVIQGSGEGNKQAIVIIDKQEGPNEQALANQLLLKINQEFGDPNSTDVVHHVPMAGFSTKKPGQNNPVTTVEFSCHRTCKTLAADMQKLRDEDSIKKPGSDTSEKEIIDLSNKQPEATEEMDKKMENLLNGLDSMEGNAVVLAFRKAYKKELGLVKVEERKRDFSVIDVSVTKTLLINGYDPAWLIRAIDEASPGLVERGHPLKTYAEKLVSNALLDQDVINALASAERARDIEYTGIE